MLDSGKIYEIIRTLIENQNKNMKMNSLLQKFKISKSDTGELVEKVNEYLKDFNMELVENQKLLIISKDNKNNVLDDKVREIIILGTIIKLEGGKISKNRLNAYEKLIKFDFKLDLYKLGYFYENKVNDDTYVEIGWRFLLEFPNFEPIKILDRFINVDIE